MWGVGPHYQGYSYGGEAYWATGLHLFTPLPYTSGELFRRIRLHAFINGGTLTECRKYISLDISIYLGSIFHRSFITITKFITRYKIFIWYWIALSTGCGSN